MIEVLIASAILMMSIGVLLQLFGSGLDRVSRAGEQAHLLTVKRVIINTLDGINPAEMAEAEGMAEGLNYSWKAAVDEPYRQVKNVPGNLRYELALFSINIDIERAGGKHHQFVYRRIGWKLVR